MSDTAWLGMPGEDAGDRFVELPTSPSKIELERSLIELHATPVLVLIRFCSKKTVFLNTEVNQIRKRCGMKKLTFIFIILFLSGSEALAQTIIPGGPVSGTWSMTGSPYLIQGEIQISNDSTLTIEPGATVEFQGHYSLNVQGRLLAIGTETDSIIFTINDTTGFGNPDTGLGGWNGIRFIDTPVTNDSSKIVYCKLQYGKAVGNVWHANAGGAICVIECDKLLVAHCMIMHNSAGGLETEVPSGGGMHLHRSDIKLFDNIISYNRARHGGALYIYESNVMLRNNTIANNTALEGGGILIASTCSPVFNNDVIINNNALNFGGGIFCVTLCNTFLYNVNFIQNFAHWGGGINIGNAQLLLENCSLIENGADETGGGIQAHISSIQINQCTFQGDTAGFQGGAINAGQCSLQINASNFIDNTASINSGALHLDTDTTEVVDCFFTGNTSIWGGSIGAYHGEIIVNNCSFTGNNAEHGGAINSGFNKLSISNSFFSANSAIWGGGMSLYNCELRIDSTDFNQNVAFDASGAIEYYADTLDFMVPYPLELRNSLFAENSAVNNFGAVRIEQYDSGISHANVLVDKCEFRSNNANRYGGLRIGGGIIDFTVSNSIFSNNTATFQTPGFSVIQSSMGSVFNCLFSSNQSVNAAAAGASVAIFSEVDFFNCTFVNSSPMSGAGLGLRRGSKASVTNSIFWGNDPNQISMVTVDTSYCTLNVNYCDIQGGIDSIEVDTLSVLNWGMGNIDVDPLFVDTLNGNYHLQHMSPCIQAGIDSLEIAGIWYYCPAMDLEGNPRPNPVGTLPDMGAYESHMPTGIKVSNNIPSHFSLKQNFPNPYNSSTIIQFDLPKTSQITLKIFNILGEEVTALVSSRLAGGSYTYEWDGSNEASGVYLYRLEAEGFIKTRKMVLVR